MSWRESLRPASYRGVPFLVDGATLNAGRRLARHEYPQRDLPYLEDMGRKAREYKVEAYVIGDDYMAARDKLLAALESEGAGQLVHHWFGTLQVVPSGDCSISESTREGGLARFSISFIEAGKQLEPGSNTDTLGVLGNTKIATEDAIANSFVKQFGVVGQPGFVGDEALKQANAVLALPGMALGNAAQLRADPLNALASLLPENMQASLRDPIKFARGVLAAVAGAQSVAAMLGYGAPVTGTAIVTPSRQALNTNTQAINGLVVQAATLHRVSALAEAQPATLDDARLSRTQIVQYADVVLLNDATGQEAADGMRQLLADAVAHFASLQPSLPRVVRIVPGVVRSAIVQAHDTYGDAWYGADREAEIVSRNRVRHPGFVPAGQSLQLVLA